MADIDPETEVIETHLFLAKVKKKSTKEVYC
jgi:hypothetical protein